MLPIPRRAAVPGLALAAWAIAVLWAVPGVHAAEADPASLRRAATASIELQEAYVALRTLDRRGIPVEVPDALPTLFLPYRSVVAAVLQHAGVEVQPDSAKGADLRVGISSHGTTRGQLYDAAKGGMRIRELRYTDAALDGELRLATATAALVRPFAAEIVPAVTIIGIVDGGDLRRDPNYAPFRNAFEAPGGFLDVLGAAVLEVWGDAPLRAALHDRDPLVRALAARALGEAPE